MANEFEKRDQFEDVLVEQIAQCRPEFVEELRPTPQKKIEDTELDETYMATYQIKQLQSITGGSKSINKLTTATEKAVNALTDELQGGVSDDNFRSFERLLRIALDAQLDLGEQVDNLENSLKALKRDVSKQS